MSIQTIRLDQLTSDRRLTRPDDVTRWLVVALLAVAAVAHIPLVGEHLMEAPYMGVLFVLFTAAALLTAGALALKASALRYAAATGLCAAAVVTYAATRLVAFPQLADDVGAWAEPLGVLSIAVEAAVVVLGARKLAQQAQPAGRQVGVAR